MSNTNKILDEWLDKLPNEIRDNVKNRLLKSINYEPKIGIMGKSGAGKSSLINGILSRAACKTGGVGGCTRAFQEERININGSFITFVDLPGIAESKAYHQEYERLYAQKIKDLDLIIWVIKVDDRANKNDEEFYEELIQYYEKKRILFVLSQCDKAEPSRTFDYSKFKPSSSQLDIIKQNQRRLCQSFNVLENYVIPVACDYYEGKFDNWNIPELVTRIISVVPAESASPLIKVIPNENKTQEAKKEAKSGFRETVEKIIDIAIDYAPVPPPIKTLLRETKALISKGVEKLWDFFFD
ncbi:GTPase family protein [Haemophilus haemolyticus]|uniref:GTPase family protein n=1 Tax=Haemophilus haemolyticus TaxID=726 RepID=UPI0008034D11|nr:GTPase [Haemophilus haemolyticus]OBX88553.1 GTP-binding protein [Haemophilus haemolyticus]